MDAGISMSTGLECHLVALPVTPLVLSRKGTILDISVNHGPSPKCSLGKGVHASVCVWNWGLGGKGGW